MSKLIHVVQRAMAVLTNGKGFDRIAKPVEIISAAEGGKFKFRWKVEESQANGFGTMHGGFTAYMVDFSTTAALMTLGKNIPGVTIEMGVSYLNSAKIGETVIMETDCTKLGSTLAFMEAKLSNSEGKLLATAKHTKFIGARNKPTTSS